MAMADSTFRLPVAGFEQISRILRAYLAASKHAAGVPVKLDDVSKRAAMNKTIVSGNNAFLASLGLIEGGNSKSLTDRGLQAALTLDHPETAEAFKAWGEVIEESADLERVVDAVRIRKGMDEDALLSHIVLTAGVPKTARSLTGARTVIDIIEFAGLLDESDGTFSATSPRYGEAPGPAAERLVESIGDTSGARGASASLREGARAVVNVHIWVNAKDADLAEFADELKELLSKLSES